MLRGEMLAGDDRSDMHLALVADVMCGELWPQHFGLSFHHDFSVPISIFLTASAACQYSLPSFTLFTHRAESVGSKVSWRGGEPPAYHRPSRRGAPLSDRRIAFGSEALCLSAIYYKSICSDHTASSATSACSNSSSISNS